MPWQLEIRRRALRQLARLPEHERNAIESTLDRLIVDPTTADLKKLGGKQGEWRIRVGRWRVILELDNHSGLMTVVDVLPRDRAYRD